MYRHVLYIFRDKEIIKELIGINVRIILNPSALYFLKITNQECSFDTLTAVCQSGTSFSKTMGSRASIQLQEAELNEIQSETGCK